MIDLLIPYLVLIVVILLFIIAFLTFYIIYQRRKLTKNALLKDQRIVVPLLTVKSKDKSSGDHSNSVTHKRLTKRLRHRPRTLFIRAQNSHGFLLSNSELSMQNHRSNSSAVDQTTIQLHC